MKTLVLLCTALGLVGSALAKDSLDAELEALHTKWFAAFDRGDGAAMNELEASNLVLVLPDGSFFKKTSPRANKGEPTGVTNRMLRDASIRRFGDSAILTGVLRTTFREGTKEESKDEATTVVWIRENGSWRIASAQWTAIQPNKSG